LADRADPQRRGAQLSAVKRAAAGIFADDPISVRMSRDHLGEERVVLHIQSATVSIDDGVLYLSGGTLDRERLSALAERLNVRYAWWRDATQFAENDEEESDEMPRP